MLRLTVFGTAVLLALAGRSVPAAAEPSEDGVEESGQSAPEAAPAAEGGEAKAKPKVKRQRSGRRSRHHGRFAGRVVPESQLRKEPLEPPSGDLVIASQGFKEEARVNIYNDDGSYDIEALRTLDHVLRCRRTDVEKPIEPRLFTILSHIYDHFGGKTIELVSGYRNQRKQTSNHYKGTASDIRIAGVSPKKIEAFAETLDMGGMGIGIYPRSAFVHIDVRPLPSFRWTDYSPPNSNASEKRPPRGWKRKKLQS